MKKQGLNLLVAVSMLGMVSGTYTSRVYAESETNIEQDTTNTATLANLKVTGIALDQPFSKDVHEYSATVENDVKTIQLLVESSDLAASIVINGKPIISGKEETVSLQTGTNTFLITINDGNQTAAIYTLKITKKQSANNLLQNIKLSAGELSPSFVSTVTDYSVQVANDVHTIMVTPTTMDGTAKIEVNNTLVKDEGVSVNLPDGKTDINISVTAENGDEKIYKLHITKAEATSPQNNSSQSKDSVVNTNFSQNHIPTQTSRADSFQPASMQMQNAAAAQKTSKATLSSLTVSEGTWGSTFSKDKFTYHVAVSSDTKTITINPAASYNVSSITINGENSNTIQLEDDSKTIIPIVVTYDDGDRKTYVLVFDKTE